MAAISTDEIPAPDELARIIDGIIRQRILIAIQEEEQYVKLQQKQIEQLNEKRRGFWNNVKRWADFVNSWFLTFLMLGSVYFLGIYTGVNLLPKGIICQEKGSLCYWLRFDNNKRSIR